MNPRAQAAVATRTPPQILLIEDNPQMRKLVSLQLEEAGFEVMGKSALFPALDLLASGFAPSCAIVDLHLPNGSGLTIVRQLLAVEGRWPIVIVTGEYDDLWAVEAYALGPRVQQYVLKSRLSATENSATERGGITIVKLVVDAMARQQSIQRDLAAKTALAVAAAVPPTPWTTFKRRIAEEFAERRVLRWLLRGFAATLVGLGAAMVRMSASRPGAFWEIVGTLISATGGALGIYVMGPGKKEA